MTSATEDFIPRMATSLVAKDSPEDCIYISSVAQVSTTKQLALKPNITLPKMQVVFIAA